MGLEGRDDTRRASPAAGERLAAVREIMTDFSRRTGLADGGGSPRRYLWTDAFAVCNFLELDRSGEPAARGSALRLVDQVHSVLGRHRADDPRSGWISGLPEEEGRVHPTRGGLRIGKTRNERGPGEPFDERAEWDRDGQYFHYLTKWMLALARVARATEDGEPLRHAVELARAAHAAFTRPDPETGGPGLAWKMSIDLTRPLVASRGQHDPLDGLLTLRELRSEARRMERGEGESQAAALDGPIEELLSLCVGAEWATADPLGIVGLLGDTHRAARLLLAGEDALGPHPGELLDCATAGLSVLLRARSLGGPAEHRLAFRELGLSIGLHAVERLAHLVERDSRGLLGRDLQGRLEVLLPVLPLAEDLELFWLDPANRAADSWRAHLDINAVMLATSLMPDGFLGSDASG